MKLQYLPLLILLILVIQICAGGVIYWSLDSWANRASFGDMFGAVDTLFSGLAFAGVIYTILLQKQELELQREEIKRYREIQQAKYLHIDIGITDVGKDYLLTKVSIENRSEEPKKIENSLLLVAPEYENPIDSFNFLAKKFNFSKQVHSTNDIADIKLTEPKYSEGRVLFPIPFFYSENITIADERLSYQVPIKISEMQEGMPYSVRFFVHGEEGRLHRTTHDSFVVPYRNIDALRD